MGIFAYLSPSPKLASVKDVEKEKESVTTPTSTEPAVGVPSDATPASPPLSPVSSPVSAAKVSETTASEFKAPARRFSFRTFSVQPSNHDEHKHALSAIQEREKRDHAAAALSKRRLTIPIRSNEDKRAQESALVVRRLIIGPTNASSPSLSLAVAKPQMSKLKSQLIQSKSANKVIAHLRTLPSTDEGDSHSKSTGPIHAVCLARTDAEEHQLHFRKLISTEAASAAPESSLAQMTTASVETMSSVFNEMHVVDLIKSPDLGLGQPGDGVGILSGAVPTAQTIINGIEQITPQLMALGYATGRAILPDHSGIHPPTDRMSVLTYWWGLEVVLPPPSLAYLSNAHSVSGTVVNFLSALAVVNNGVREILPFVRYISQFIDFEFQSIQAQDQGQGVVCAATWIMPAAMVPRPWDFLPPESKAPKSEEPDTPVDGDKAQPSIPIDKVPSSTDAPSPAKPTQSEKSTQAQAPSPSSKPIEASPEPVPATSDVPVPPALVPPSVPLVAPVGAS